MQELERVVEKLKESESQLVQSLEDCERDLVHVRESRAMLQVCCPLTVILTTSSV